jgi:hypothetical protein
MRAVVREWLVLQGSGHDYQSRPDPIPRHAARSMKSSAQQSPACAPVPEATVPVEQLCPRVPHGVQARIFGDATRDA